MSNEKNEQNGSTGRSDTGSTGKPTATKSQTDPSKKPVPVKTTGKNEKPPQPQSTPKQGSPLLDPAPVDGPKETTQQKKPDGSAPLGNLGKSQSQTDGQQKRVEDYDQNSKVEAAKGQAMPASTTLESLHIEFNKPATGQAKNKIDTLALIQDLNRQMTSDNQGTQSQKAEAKPSLQSVPNNKLTSTQMIGKELLQASKLQSQSQPALSPVKKEFKEKKPAKNIEPKLEQFDEGQVKKEEKDEARDEYESKNPADTPDIRLTTAKKGEGEDEVDPFVLDNEMLILQKIISERILREGEIRA